jgi:hypothetical protein
MGVLPSGALTRAEQSAGERSEPQQRGATAKVSADLVSASRPDPEVVAKPNRRTDSAEYKQWILAAAEAAAAMAGGVGALLWRKGLCTPCPDISGGQSATWASSKRGPPKIRGPKSKRNPLGEENQKFRRQNARLAEKLSKVELII